MAVEYLRLREALEKIEQGGLTPQWCAEVARKALMRQEDFVGEARPAYINRADRALRDLIGRELYVIGLYYPKEAEEIHKKLKSDHGRKLWACRRLNEIREMLGLSVIMWPERDEKLPTSLFKHLRRHDDRIEVAVCPCVMVIEPDRYEILECDRCYAYFDQLNIKEPIDHEDGLRFLGGKLRWEHEIKADGSQHLRVALARTKTNEVVRTRPLTSKEGIR